MKNKIITVTGLLLSTIGICLSAITSGDLLVYSLLTAFVGVGILGFLTNN